MARGFSSAPGASAECVEASASPIEKSRMLVLGTSKNGLVRAAIAERADCPFGLMVTLAHDYSVEVRTAVAANPRALRSVLQYLAADRSTPVILALVENSSLPEDVLEELAFHKKSEVRAAATRRIDTGMPGATDAHTEDEHHPEIADHVSLAVDVDVDSDWGGRATHWRHRLRMYLGNSPPPFRLNPSRTWWSPPPRYGSRSPLRRHPTRREASPRERRRCEAFGPPNCRDRSSITRSQPSRVRPDTDRLLRVHLRPVASRAEACGGGNGYQRHVLDPRPDGFIRHRDRPRRYRAPREPRVARGGGVGHTPAATSEACDVQGGRGPGAHRKARRLPDGSPRFTRLRP